MPWSTNDASLPYLIALSRFPKFGSRALLKLKKSFDGPEKIWQASFDDLLQTGLDNNAIADFLIFKNSFDLSKEAAKLKKEAIKIVALDDPLYPPLLKEISDPPVILYYKGVLKAQEKCNIAIVGSRLITPYGVQITPEIVSPLVRAGLTIVSGLAIGVDALAHLSTVKARGRAIAVLGSGIDEASLYPRQNRRLAEQIIAEGGTIVSEFPIGASPLKQNFPIRNRVISGLSLGTVIIEAAKESGSLITAHSALEQNREVFAVPGSIYAPTSAGPNNLLKMGAKMVTSATDILEALNLQYDKDSVGAKKITPDNPAEAALLPLLSNEPQYIDNLVKSSRLATQEVMSALTMMEIKGKVRHLGGMTYVLNN